MDIISTDDPNFPELGNEQVNSQVVENKGEVLNTTYIEGEGENKEQENIQEVSGAPSAEWDGKVQYNGMDWDLDIPEEYTKELESKGLDAKAIAKELYSSSSFSLSDETKAKLDAAYGKFTVDMYLSTLKQNNDNYVKNYQYEQESAKAQEQQMQQWGADQISEKFQSWDDFESAVLSSFSDSQLDQFNAAMQSGNKFVQEYAFKAALGALQSKPDTIQPRELGSSAPDTSGAALTAAQYSAEMQKVGATYRTDRAGYQKAMQALDQRRLAGISRGI